MLVVLLLVSACAELHAGPDVMVEVGAAGATDVEHDGSDELVLAVRTAAPPATIPIARSSQVAVVASAENDRLFRPPRG